MSAGWWCFWQFTLLSSLQFFGFTSPQTAWEVTVSSSPLMLLFIKINVSGVVGCSTAVRMLTFCLQNSCFEAFSIHQNYSDHSCNATWKISLAWLYIITNNTNEIRAKCLLCFGLCILRSFAGHVLQTSNKVLVRPKTQYKPHFRMVSYIQNETRSEAYLYYIFKKCNRICITDCN